MKRKLFTAIIAAPLMLSACGGDARVSDTHADLSELNTSSLTQRIDSIVVPDSSYTDVDDVYNLMGDLGFTWADARESGNSIVFQDMTGNDYSAKEVTLSGIEIIDGKYPFPAFLAFKDLSMQDSNLQAGTGAFYLGTGELAELFIESFSMDQEDFEGGMKFLMDYNTRYHGGGYIKNLKTVVPDEFDMQMEYVGMWSEAGDVKTDVILEGILMRGEDENAEHLEISVGEFKMTDFDFSFMAIPDPEDVESVMGAAMDMYNPFTPVSAAIEFRDVVVATEAVKMEMPSYISTMTPIVDGKFQTRSETTFRYVFNDDLFDLPPEGLQLFKDLELWPPNISYKTQINLDQDADIFDLEYLTLSLPEKADIEVRFKAEGIDKMLNGMSKVMAASVDSTEPLSPESDSEMELLMEDYFQQQMSELVIHEFTLAIEEHKFLNTAIEAFANYRNDDPDALRSQVSAALALPTLAAQSQFQSEMAMSYLEAAQGFVESGGRIEMTMKPLQPLSVIDVIKTIESGDLSENDAAKAADDILKLLNIDFEHIPH